MDLERTTSGADLSNEARLWWSVMLVAAGKPIDR